MLVKIHDTNFRPPKKLQYQTRNQLLMKKNLLLTLAVSLLFSVTGLAQSKKVSGTVTDENSKPIERASVKQKGTTNGEITNAKGEFTITLLPGKSTVLEISAVGYRTQELDVKSQTHLSVKMPPDMQGLDEVVIIGYQKVTRKKATAAISSITGKELENLPSASFDQLLQGRLSGVNVQNFSGDPGSRAAVSVRGSTLVNANYDENMVVSSPLYVVDGVPQSNEEYVTPGAGTGMNYLGGVNPNDIESIDVLKDASAAAIYGSRAANGVILITTKKGKPGKVRVIFSGFGGITEKPELREVTLGTLERRQKMRILQEQLEYNDQRQLPYMLTDSLNPAFNGATDWQDLFYRTGVIKDADLSLSGGDVSGTSYRFSTGFYDEQGILKATGYKRYSVILNLMSHALNKKLDINPVINFTRSDRSRGLGVDPRYGGSSAFSLSAGSMPSSLFNLSPTKKAGILETYDESLDKNMANVFNLNLNLGYSFNSHLKFNSLNSYQYKTSHRNFNRTNAMESNAGNYSYTYYDQNIQLLTSNYFSYVGSLNKNNFSGVLGQDITFNTFENASESGSQGAADNIQVIQGFTQKNITAYSDYQAYGLLSYYGRFSYDYDSRYLLSFAGRWDGSSRFGGNSKWGFFPSASAAWIISDEKFFSQNSRISLLKMRASIGTSGSLPPDNYLQYNLYSVNAGGYGVNGSATSYNGVAAVTPNFYNGAAQQGLSWEKSMQWNIGADMEIQQGKYAVSMDIYNKESSLQLFSVNLPLTTGYSVALTNSIGVRNAGVELTIAANPLPNNSPVRWFSRLNISYNKNTIMNLPNGNRDLVLSGDRFDKSHILSVGSAINTFYLYKTLGVYSTDADIPVNPYNGEKYHNSNGTYTAGDFYFQDLDGDNLIDIFNSGLNPDKMPIGDPNPKITGGWTNDFTWKNFTLGLFFNFVFDRDVLNLFHSDQFNNSTDGNPNENFAQYSTPNLDKIDIWRKSGDKATYAKYDLGTYLYYYTSAQTFFLEKGDFVRLKSINLQYNLPYNIVSKWKIDGFKVFAVVDNALKWQKSKLLPDAEAVNSYGEYNGAGYPIPRKYTLGFELHF